MEPRKKIIEKMSQSERDDFLSRLAPFLSQGKFVNVASCNMERMPNVAPKLVGKVDKNILYLIDYVVGRTYANLKANPRISISFIDDKSLTGYQLNGTADILEEGTEYDDLAREFQQIKTNFTVERILLNVRTGEKNAKGDIPLSEKFVIIRIKVIEVVEITSTGALRAKFAVE